MTGRPFIAICYLVFTVMIVAQMPASHALQEFPPCGAARPTTIDTPWSGAGDLWCLEGVLDDNSLGVIATTQIAAAPDGSLYATMPYHSALAHITDTDNDRLPDTLTVVATDLTRPTGIVIHDGLVYVSGNQHIYRYSPETEMLTVLIDDLPYGYTGYPTGGMTVQDDRLYVGAGGNVECDTGRGAIYSFDLDGSDRQTVATGLHSPMDLAVFAGEIWIADTENDRIVQLIPGADYGFCSDASPPDAQAYTFPAESAPIALYPNHSDLYPHVANRLFVALRGNVGNPIIQGYEVVAVGFDADAVPTDEVPVLPTNSPHLNISDQRMQIQGTGFYPHHVYGVTVDTNGWIYVSAGNGRVVALRPL